MLKYEDYVRRKQKQEGVDKLGENQGTEGLTKSVDLDSSFEWLINGRMFNALIESRRVLLLGSESPQIRDHCTWCLRESLPISY